MISLVIIKQQYEDSTDMKKLLVFTLVASISLQSLTACNSASTTAKNVSEKVQQYVSTIDTAKFKSGWDYAAKYTGTALETLKGKNYVTKVQTSITETSEKMQKELIQKVKDSDYVSPDHGMKYYINADSSAQAQAKQFFEDYQKYCSENKDAGDVPMSINEFLDQYDNDLDSIYDSIGKDPAKLGVNPSEILSPTYILKQAITSKKHSAIVKTAFLIGPDVYAILIDAAKNGKIDEKKLKENGINGLLDNSNGFVEGSVSSALVTACESGKFGKKYKDMPPETVGTLTVLIVDSIRYGYQLSNGEITEEEYADMMAQEIIITIASQASGILLQTLFPFIPFAYMTGSMAGAMLASAGYNAGKEIILEVRGEKGFETVVPEKLSSGDSLATSFMSNLKLTDTFSEFQHKAVSTIGNGKIKVSNK